MNINATVKWGRGLTIVGLAVGMVSIALAPISYAYNATEYTTSKLWQVGMLASLDTSGNVAYASRANNNYIGVVTAVNGSSIDVANSGTVAALVTNETGIPTKGDKIQLSDYAGIATVSTGSGKDLGVVKAKPDNWQTLPLTGSDKSASSIKVASVEVQLIDQSGGGLGASNPFLAVLQQTGNGVAGKTVDMWRIITSLLIGIGGLILSFGLLFITSRESFFSMGRNPLAGSMIMKGLWKMVVLSVVIMCGSLAAAYLILRVG